MKAVSPLTKRLAKLLLVLLLIFFVTPVVFGAVEEPAPLSVDPIACTTGTTISGTVYEADGSTPLSGAIISFRDFTTDGELYTATTDGSGNFSCDPAVGNYRIYAEGGGYHRTYYSAADYENATNVTVIVSTMLTGVDFVLDTPVNIPEHLLFNFNDPIIAELAVRQAIAYGTDRERMIAETWPYSPVNHSIMISRSWAYTLDGVPQYAYNPTMAASLLTAAGWVDTNSDGIRDKGGVPLHLDYVYRNTPAERTTIASIFEENMEAIGIDVTVTGEPNFALLFTGSFSVYQYADIYDLNTNDYDGEGYHTSSPTNWGGYSNLTADGYLNSAALESTRAGKLPYLHDHQALVITDLAELPLLQRCNAPDSDCDGIADLVDTNLPTDDFVITVKTDNTGGTSSTQFQIPTTGSGYNYNVDCNNDGLFEASAQSGNYTCDYSTLGGAGTYTIRIQDNAGDSTGFPRIYFNNSGDKLKLIDIEQWGSGKWTSMGDAFDGCSNMTMSATDAPDLTNVTSMWGMFYEADSFNGDIGGWDVSNVEDMTYMFYSADNFNQDIGNWVTSSLSNMTYLFAHAESFNQDIGSWDTSDATTMYGMFYGAYAFNQDLSAWNVSSLTNAGEMFNGVQLSTYNYDALLKGWDAQVLESNVTFSGGISNYCTGEAARENMDISDNWTITDGGKDCSELVVGEMFYSQAAYDGWVLETGENTNKGGLINTSNLICNVGDDAANKQYRTILHFNTSRIPDDAIVTKVTLQYKQHSIIGSDPYATHGNIWADIKDGFFSNNPGLVVSDFAAGPSMGFAGNFSLYPSSLAYPIYRATLNDTALQYVNLDGITQFRLRFAIDDDNDNTADYLKIFCGDMPVPFNRPVLRVWYYLP